MTRRQAICTLAAIPAAAAVPERIVVATFDDAAVTHATYVAPLLAKYGFGATFFVCEFPPDFDDKSKYMTWNQIRAVNDAGFEIGNHTRSHTHVTQLSRDQFAAELKYIEDRCEGLGIPRPVSFAYPGYQANAMAVDILTERGYRFARAGGNRVYDLSADNPLLIPSFSTSGSNRDRVVEMLKQADGSRRGCPHGSRCTRLRTSGRHYAARTARRVSPIPAGEPVFRHRDARFGQIPEIIRNGGLTTGRWDLYCQNRDLCASW